MATDAMTRRERDDLARLTRQRERLAKAMVAQRASELLADFEQQLAAEYRFDDDDIWRQAMEAADDAVRAAEVRVDERCAELGIPKAFRPSIGGVCWWSRGENAVASRRAELRKVAQTRIAAMEKLAKRHIEAASLEVQTNLLAEGLTSRAALSFLDAMPTPEALMPTLVMAEVAQALPDRLGLE
jgi:hypothetical protein